MWYIWTQFHFSDWPGSKDNVKRALLQFQIQPKELGPAEIYLLAVFLGIFL